MSTLMELQLNLEQTIGKRSALLEQHDMYVERNDRTSAAHTMQGTVVLDKLIRYLEDKINHRLKRQKKEPT